MFELSVIIPVYNEEESVEILLTELTQVLSKLNYRFEVIFVDDGSTDNTVSRLRKLAITEDSLRIICHKHNYGQSTALVTGARAAQYPLLVTLDGDGQNDPLDIPNLLVLMNDDKTVVFGSRVKRQDNVLKKISSYTGRLFRRWVLNDSCSDSGCSLKVFPKKAFLGLPHFNHLHRFLPTLFMRAGYTIINVPVNHRERRFGVSKYGVMNRVFVGVYDLIGVRWLLKRPCNPEVLHDE